MKDIRISIAVIGSKKETGVDKLVLRFPVNTITGLMSGIWIFQTKVPEWMKESVLKELQTIPWDFPEAMTVYIISNNGKTIEKFGL